MLFFSRFGIFKYYINRKIHHFNNNSHVELRLDKISLSGISSVSFNKMLMISKTSPDSLLAIDSANVRINVWSLLTGQLAIDNFYAKDVKIHLIDNEDYSNFLFFFNRNKDKPDNISERDYAKQINKLFKAFFYKVPSHINVNNIYALIEKNERKLRFQTNKLLLVNNNLDVTFNIIDSGKEEQLSVKGNIDPAMNKLSIIIYSPTKKFILHNFQVPPTSFILQTFSFDSLSLQITNNGINNGKLNLNGSISISKLTINNPSIAHDDVSIPLAGLSFNINASNNYIELDSASVVTANKLNFKPYIKYQASSTNSQNITNKYNNDFSLTLIINKERFKAQDLFEFFPRGMFSNLEGIKTKGELEYHLKFDVDLSNPDSLKFGSNLKKYNFGIISFGNTNITKLNSSFPYTAYDKDIPVRTFTVGPENPDFVPYKNISHYLIYSVLTSEDGGFFINRGFNEDSFRESIIKNIKERRFARGGSTITMQLVKNVFLKRNKTIGRKLEEALLAWLIENNNLCSKERMLEVYLNIIEWGPRIYGIGEASRFYFDKQPANLSLAESIYLASIIPHPKWYKYSFTENGILRDNLKGFYKLVSDKMLRKEYITQSDADNLKPEVKLKGRSLQMLMKDTLGKKVNIDSLFKLQEVD